MKYYNSLFLIALTFCMFALHSKVYGAQERTNFSSYWEEVKGSRYNSTGNEVHYYISADEVIWDYAPDGYNMITGKPWNNTEKFFTQSGPGRIGSKYLKCLFREYTDSNYTDLINKSSAEDNGYLGFLAPVISAEVGDTIKILLRNKCRFNVSMHPHGVFYLKDSEGRLYNDNTSRDDKGDDSLMTNSQYLYTWYVPERAGPGPMDGSSVVWPYHSAITNGLDAGFGPTGFISISAEGSKNESSTFPSDVDRQVYYIYSNSDENKSPYINYNLMNFAKFPYPSLDDESFQASNVMFNINGFLYGNGPMLQIKENSRIRWGLTSGEGAHAAHWHGNVVLDAGRRVDVVSIAPMEVRIGDMVPDDVGIWLFHCHFLEHMTNGMITRYEVLHNSEK